MKKVLFALVAMSLLFTACEDGNDDYIKLKEVDDVCTMMDDLELMEHCYEEYDVNKDGKVSMSEAAAVTYIDVFVDRSIKGLEYFPNLIDLEIWFYEASNIMDLDFRPFKNLKSLVCQSYYPGTSVNTINLSNNKLLEELIIGSFNCPSLDLSKCTQLKEVSSAVPIVNLSNCTQLESLKYWDDISKLDLSKCTQLKSLEGEVNGDYDNPTKIDLSNNKLLESLTLTGSNDGSFISELDLGQHTKFTYINFTDVLCKKIRIDNGNVIKGNFIFDCDNYPSVAAGFYYVVVAESTYYDSKINFYNASGWTHSFANGGEYGDWNFSKQD